MRFVVDHQLPPRLATYLRARGFDAIHVSDIGLHLATDRTIWSYAKSEAMQIISKDEDFFYLTSVDRDGPRLIWVRTGNVRVLFSFEPSTDSGLVSSFG